MLKFRAEFALAWVNMTSAIHTSHIDNLEMIASGKIRDIYHIDEYHMLIVTTDRLSAFDVVLPDPIPQKGKILTSISNFWFDRSSDLIQNHISALDLKNYVSTGDYKKFASRSIIVKKLKTLPVEAIVRGYIIGSGWKDYQNSGEICGISLPAGLQQAEKLDQPIFTPSSKASIGDHDINITFQQSVDLIGKDLANQVRQVSLQLYTMAAEYALTRGIIIADTKFEFGTDEQGKLVLIDEILTPDSSRFWPVDSYQVGVSPPSFDKQFVRDYLETLDWDKTNPGPKLPAEIIEKTREKYLQVQSILLDIG